MYIVIVRKKYINFMEKSIGILFDYNGVIADDEQLHEAAFGRVLSLYDITLMSEMYRKFCFGRTDKKGFEKLQEHFPGKLADQSINALVGKKQEEYQKLLTTQDIFYPEILKVIFDLKSFAKLGIVTSSTRAELFAALENNKFISAFDVFITAEDIIKGKPNPEGYLKGVKTLGLLSDRIVAIEDSSSGVRAAKSAGIKCIAVLHTSAQEELTLADVIVEKIGNVNKRTIFEALGLVF